MIEFDMIDVKEWLSMLICPNMMKCISTIRVGVEHPILRDIKHLDFGVHVADDNKKKIYIFCVDKNTSNYFPRFAAWVCFQILEKLGIKGRIQDFKWSYVTLPVVSKIRFHEMNGYAVSVELVNGEICKSYISSQRIETYAEALNHKYGISEYLQTGYPENLSFISGPMVKYLVHTPKHEQKIHTVDHPYTNLPIDEHPVFLADTNKFISHWKKQSANTIKNKLLRLFGAEPQFTNLDNCDLLLLSALPEISLNHHIPNEMATGVGIDYDNKIKFTNGRHRTVNFANLGAPYIPMQVHKEQLHVFQNLFHWSDSK